MKDRPFRVVSLLSKTLYDSLKARAGTYEVPAVNRASTERRYDPAAAGAPGFLSASFGVNPMIWTPAPRATSMASITS